MAWRYHLNGIEEARKYAASIEKASETLPRASKPSQSSGLTLRERLKQGNASQDQLSASGGQAEDSPPQGSEAVPASKEHKFAPNRGLNEAQDTEAADYVPSTRLPGTRAWDRRFKGLNVPERPASPSEQPESSSSLQTELERDTLERNEALQTFHDGSAAPSKGADEEDDLFTWEPKAKEDSESKGAGAKRKKAAPKESKPRKKKKAQDRSEDNIRKRGSAAVHLANAPHDGPDEPLLLHYNPENGGEAVNMQVPANINKFLRSYQRDGVRFLFRQYAQNKGGILADDMGLGKTVQTIGFLAAILGKTGTNADLQANTCDEPEGRKQILLVVPTSVITNWQRELSTWGAFVVAIFHGDRDKRSAALESIRGGQAEILITSYDLCRNNIESITGVDWHVAVFDEAHKLKNDDSATYKAASQLHAVTNRIYGLSGTVMQNTHKELWALLNWANPGSLSDWTSFERHYVDPLKIGQKKDCSDLQLAKAEKYQAKLEDLLSKYMLRRTKDGTIKDQLPIKTDNVVFCRLAPMQYRAYKRVLETPDFQLLVRAEEPCGCGSMLQRSKCCHTRYCHFCILRRGPWAYPEEGGVLWPHFHLCDCDGENCNRHRPDGCESVHTRLRCPVCLILPCLIILQKISNHLELLKVDPDDRTMAGDGLKLPRAKELARLVFGEDLDALAGDTLERSWLHVSSSLNCGKMKALEQLLQAWHAAGDNKVLLFCHSVKMLNIIEQQVLRSGYHFARLDGSTRQQDRQQLCDDFNSSASLFLFLISTTAGGLGLNLTAANKVVIVDPSWNPAHDLQAQDRAFRIGQRRDVAVYRLIAAGTLEEMIYTRQVYKQQQAAVATEGSKETRFFEGVQGKKDQKGELWGMCNLFKESLHKVTAQEIFADERPDVHYHVKQMDTLEYGALEEADAEPEGLPEDLDDVQGEDTGLGQLARRVAAEAMEGADGDARPTGQSTAAEAPEMQHLKGTGMLGMHRHGELLGGNDEERLRRECAARDHAATLEMEDGGGPAPLLRKATGAAQAQRPAKVMNALESLAAWKNMDSLSMAKLLVGMTAEARTELRASYAALAKGNDKRVAAA